MWKMVMEREIGSMAPSSFTSLLEKRRVSSIELARNKEIVSAHKSGINSLQVDSTEERYLISGASDGSVAAYDIQQPSSYGYNSCTQKHEALFSVDKRAHHGHTYCVSCVHWYPIDTGIFITGSFDHFVNVWDTNTTQVELQFNMSKKVYAIGMSGLATAHMLIAAGTEDTRVRLCDMASGAFTHTLTGHRDSVWAVQWSRRSEWVLVTGGCDGAIRFWDIRRAGCYKVLDQHHSQIGRRPAVLKQSSETQRSSAVVPSKKLALKSQRSQVKPVGPQKGPDLRTAHYGSVTGLQMTYDGLFLLSAGTDSRVRLWDVESGANTLVHYPSVKIRGNKGMQMALSSDSSLLFIPSANLIEVFNVWSGESQAVLHGHYDVVNCCSFHPQEQELYSGSNDRQILAWAAPTLSDTEEPEAGIQSTGVQPDEDTWSD